MKKLFFAILTILAATTAFAGNTNNKNEAILSKFKNSFREATNIEVTPKAEYVDILYTENREQTHAYYSLSGEFIGTSKAVAIDDLPTNAKRTFAKKYAGFIVKEAFRFEGENELAYYVSAEKDNQSVVLKVSEGGRLSVYKKTGKK